MKFGQLIIEKNRESYIFYILYKIVLYNLYIFSNIVKIFLVFDIFCLYYLNVILVLAQKYSYSC